MFFWVREQLDRAFTFFSQGTWLRAFAKCSAKNSLESFEKMPCLVCFQRKLTRLRFRTNQNLLMEPSAKALSQQVIHFLGSLANSSFHKLPFVSLYIVRANSALLQILEMTEFGQRDRLPLLCRQARFEPCWKRSVLNCEQVFVADLQELLLLALLILNDFSLLATTFHPFWFADWRDSATHRWEGRQCTKKTPIL